MFSAVHAPPPIRHHHTTQIPQSRALDLISAYLDAAKATTDINSTTSTAASPTASSNRLPNSTTRNSIPTAASALKGAALHPNAVLTEAGPVVPAGGVAGLVLRNLERVRAGLKGEFWAAEPAEEGLELAGGGKEQGFPGGKEMEMDGADREEGWEDGWQDKEEFEREQEQEVFVRDDDVTGKDVPSLKATPALLGEGSKLAKKSNGDTMTNKQARKQAKRERRKKEKRLRETARETKDSPGG